MINFCRCGTGPKLELDHTENLQSRRDLGGLEINEPKVSKQPKLMGFKRPLRYRGESAEIPEFDKLPVLYKKEFPPSKPFLQPPGRKDSERGGDSTNLSNSNINDTSRQGRSSDPYAKQAQTPRSLLILDDGITKDHLQAIFEDGSELKRNAITKSSHFNRFAEKYGTGALFDDFVEFRRYQAKRTDKRKKTEVDTIVKSRLPAHKVVSMKEYRKQGRGRAKSLAPKKSILSKKGRTMGGVTQSTATSPDRKQVTFSKHNTVLIFVKEDQPVQTIDF